NALRGVAEHLANRVRRARLDPPRGSPGATLYSAAMGLAAGDRLGPYEVLDSLGAGGMGEGYRARDSRLGRDVAIKVLPTRSANDPALRERFAREAQVVSSLNHPHICTLHDLGTEGTTSYLVMELLDGETLAKRLERGAMKLDLAL